VPNLSANLSDRGREDAERLGRPVFGAGIDPVSAGKLGGARSGLARRSRKQRQLEAKIAASQNGYALSRLLTIRREDEAALLAERRRQDDEVRRLEAEAKRVEQRLEALKEDSAELELERDSLDAQADASDLRLQELGERLVVMDERVARREAELRRRAEQDTELVELLREIGEQRVERALRMLGWVEADA
jgi:hypothetical protein